MGDAPAGRAWIEIARPVDRVRAHFFDLPALVRAQPYHGVVLSWALAEGASGGRVRQTIRVLDQAIVDDFVVEEGADGAWVRRFVDGPNRGGRYVATFSPAGQGQSARVDVEAFAPKTGFMFGVGKLSPLGVDKAMKKLLDEHKNAIEGYAFVPGSVRSPVGRAVHSLGDLVAPVAARADRERHAAVATILEAASVVMLADSVADDAEHEVLDEAARALCDARLDDHARAVLVRGAARGISDQGIALRCEALGQRLARLGCEEVGLAIAALVAAASHGIDPHELAALERLAAGARVADARLADLMARVDVATHGGKPLAPPKRAG